MSDIFILYFAITYLFNLGVSKKGWIDAKDDKGMRSDLLLNLLFSPLTVPIILGMIVYENNN